MFHIIITCGNFQKPISGVSDFERKYTGKFQHYNNRVAFDRYLKNTLVGKLLPVSQTSSKVERKRNLSMSKFDSSDHINNSLSARKEYRRNLYDSYQTTYGVRRAFFTLSIHFNQKKNSQQYMWIFKKIFSSWQHPDSINEKCAF